MYIKVVVSLANCLDVGQLKGYIKADAQFVTVKTGDKSQMICLEYQKTGYGQKRFLVCPICSKRVQRLYQVKNYDWKCQKCSGVNPYHGIQNNTKGGYDEIAYRMQRIAEKNSISFTFPFNYLDFAFDERMRRKKFRNCIKIMQTLENMRFYSLFFSVTYKPKVIKLVITGKHPLMQNITLNDLKNNIYDWNTGKQILLSESKVNALVKGI